MRGRHRRWRLSPPSAPIPRDAISADGAHSESAISTPIVDTVGATTIESRCRVQHSQNHKLPMILTLLGRSCLSQQFLRRHRFCYRMLMTLGGAVCPVRNKLIPLARETSLLTIPARLSFSINHSTSAPQVRITPCPSESQGFIHHPLHISIFHGGSDVSTQELSARRLWACPLWNTEETSGLRRVRLWSAERGRQLQRGSAHCLILPRSQGAAVTLP